MLTFLLLICLLTGLWYFAFKIINRFTQKNRLKLSVFIVVCLFGIFWLWKPDNLFDKPYSTTILDSNKELLDAKIADDGQWRFKDETEVPPKFETCILEFEDAYFYQHPGINPVSLTKSLINNVKSGKIISGGSTITMQLARMFRNRTGKSYLQKMIEILFAFRIELSHSKKEILKTYVDNAPYGGNVVGLAAASWRYFGRSPQDLSWAENATLAILPNAPSLIYPGKNRELLIQKRNNLLKKLFLQNKIDKKTYLLSLSETIPDNPIPLPHSAPHFLEQNILKFGKGQAFHTFIKKNLQERVAFLVNNHVEKTSANNIHNACALVAEINTGNIIAYVGNAENNKNLHDNYVDVIQAPRSTGSILKPFLYVHALNDGMILPASFQEDVPTQFGSYGPRNFHETYDGLVPADQALARSLNVPAVKMLSAYGVERFQKQLKHLGFSTFTKPPSHYGLSLILGGGEATIYDIASAYASLGRSLNKPKETFHNFSLLYHIEDKSSTKKELNIEPGAIWFMVKAMTELVRPMDYVGWMQFKSKQKFAWKTGTSFGFRDAWAVGMDANHIIAVWIGNADGEGRPELTGSTAAAPLLFSIYNAIQPHTWFTKPKTGFEKINVCTETGFPATDICPDTKIEEVQVNGKKVKPCTFHQWVMLDETGKNRVNSDCYPVTKMKKVARLVLSPSQEFYYKQGNLQYQPLPDFLPECLSVSANNDLEILYPRENFTIYLPTLEKGNKEKLVLKSTHKSKNATLFWYLNNEFIGQTKEFHQITVNPPAGKHRLMVLDDKGASVIRNFEVVEK